LPRVVPGTPRFVPAASNFNVENEQGLTGSLNVRMTLCIQQNIWSNFYKQLQETLTFQATPSLRGMCSLPGFDMLRRRFASPKYISKMPNHAT
jgi:hypothetical protein